MGPRSARPEDHAIFTRFFSELGVDDPVPDQAIWESFLPTAFFIENSRSEAIGYGLYRVYGTTAHVVHVVTHPDYRGQGIGRAILREMALRLRASGCSHWYLNVKPTNLPAVQLYLSSGFRPAHRSLSLELDWSALEKLPAAPEALQAQRSDAELESAFDVNAGQLAHSRQRGYRVVSLESGGCPVALAAFDPHFPGAFPFRSAEPRWARPLLEAMQPFALPEHAWVRLTVENDPDLAGALLAAGARTKIEIQQMRGVIPS